MFRFFKRSFLGASSTTGIVRPVFGRHAIFTIAALAMTYNYRDVLKERMLYNIAFAESKKTNSSDPYRRSRNKEKLDDDAVIICGSSNPELGKSVASYLGKPLGDT